MIRRTFIKSIAAGVGALLVGLKSEPVEAVTRPQPPDVELVRSQYTVRIRTKLVAGQFRRQEFYTVRVVNGLVNNVSRI